MDGFTIKPKYQLEDLVSLTRALRDPVTGCPWDKAQTHESIRQNFLEETYEVLEAIDTEDKALLQEELGDVLLQVALHAEMEREAGSFDINDVADGICQKLVLRHPHIFGDVTAQDSNTVLTNWEAIKRKEKNQKSGADAVHDVPKALPALMRSQKVQKRAGYVGFDYADINGALDDLEKEIAELRCAIKDGTNIQEEMGDVLFSAVNVARFAKTDAELALERACEKFIARFEIVERLAAEQGINMQDADAAALDVLWKQAKKCA